MMKAAMVARHVCCIVVDCVGSLMEFCSRLLQQHDIVLPAAAEAYSTPNSAIGPYA